MNAFQVVILAFGLLGTLVASAFGADPANMELPTLESAVLESIAIDLSNKVFEVSRETLCLDSAKPDGRVTEAIRYVDNLGQQLLDADGESGQILKLNESIVAVIEALKQRRLYKYQLWAEQRLERIMLQLDKEKPSSSDRIQMYLMLGEINAAYISENMLNREIISTMATLYDGLDSMEKQQVRRLAIDQQGDPLSRIGHLNPRRTPDDF